MALPCREPWCPALVTRADKGYCDKHKKRPNNWHTKKPTAVKRTTGRKWLAIRAEAMALDGYLCRICRDEKGIMTPAIEIDHIKPLSEFTASDMANPDDYSNLRALCADCHRKVTTEQQKAGRKRANNG